MKPVSRSRAGPLQAPTFFICRSKSSAASTITAANRSSLDGK
jgi:hypothetical protein